MLCYICNTRECVIMYVVYIYVYLLQYIPSYTLNIYTIYTNVHYTLYHTPHHYTYIPHYTYTTAGVTEVSYRNMARILTDNVINIYNNKDITLDIVNTIT